MCVDDLSCVCAIVPHKILDLTATLSQSKVSSSTYEKKASHVLITYIPPVLPKNCMFFQFFVFVFLFFVFVF